MRNQKTILCSLFALMPVALVGCDEGVEANDALEDGAFELAELEEEAEVFEVESAAFEDPWEGLTPDEMSLLEHEDGTDRDAPVAVVDQLAATPDASAASAPSCILLHTWDTGIYSHSRMINTCGSTYRVKVIWRLAFDGNCVTLRDRYYTDELRGRFAHPVRVELC